MSSDKNVLFYSNFCKYCSEFLKNINEMNINFTTICVDNNKSRLPPFVKSVPTIIVQGQSQPLVGDNVFEWLKAQKNTNGPNAEEISPYHANEMGTMFSDSFSFLDSDDTKEGQPISHNFEFLGSNFSISTPEESGSNNSISSSSNKGKGQSDYDKLIQQRDSESFAQPINRI